MTKKKVYIVPHSHWDREWYFSIEDSNVLLSENIPYLMSTLEQDKNFCSYTFDAQLSIVDEYLKLYPEDKERLEKLIEDKRIFVGPWYTQTDSLLVNKESIVRNLLYGTRLGNKYGHSMEIGYLPDIFGQNQYLPSIFKGFEIENSVLQRGIYTNELNENLNFIWSSPDGEKIQANNIFLGYGPGKFLASDDKYIKEKLFPMLEKLESLNKDSNNILLPAGGDQVLVRRNFPKIVKELNEKQNKYEFILSNYEEFMKDTWKNESFKNEISGELIACQKSRIHNTIKSQRYDIKKSNYDVENKILYILEPLATIGKSLGLKYPTPWIDMMWKLLFDVHAHDSIGGCNSDETNKEILNRLEKVDRISSDLINIIKKQITTAVSEKLGRDNILVLFNTKVNKSNENVKSVIFTKNSTFNIKDLQGANIDFTLTKSEYLSGGKQVVVTAEGEKEIELPGYYRSEILINSIELPAIGYKTLLVNEVDESRNDVLVVQEINYIENEIFKVEVEPQNIRVKNKVTGYENINAFHFEDDEDAGDSYDFSPAEGSVVTVIDEFKVIEVKNSKRIKVMKLLHKNRNREIETLIELRENEDFIRVNHKISNQVENHRLRVILNTGVKSSVSLSDQGYSLIERNNENKYLNTWREEGFAEAPVPIYALENMVSLKNEEKLYTVMAKGIKEYEILDNSKIALTLFRSVGFLGKDNLLWRPGRASGINNKVVYTKDAQMLKEMHFEYAITFGDLEENFENKLFNKLDLYLDRYTSYQLQKLNLFEERVERFEIPLTLKNVQEEYSILSVENSNAIQSVLKESYEKDGFILRIFNPGIKEVKIDLLKKNIKNIFLTNLYERVLEEVNSSIEIKPRGYVTLKIVL
ncbi:MULTISPECIES: glycoside hydrolase family 38 C-terminal domain-containing protein [Clostridium]|uniref:glycoside hydrolase family 38 N-terminal domain-containing protein n=1 Tax=Clostridium TaxID=1485 RepID=UPI0018A07CD1|nr:MULTISPECIES: glycoside hydrolase family 38 C-terminal domain-containing protein [Clostridium]MBS7130795.1 alpha-mannosidase [Clostridium sp.]MDB2092365.1 glycoside hydrolase family 38 C-terminal domain-containing protein [Clostridium paraputrificum]MDU2283457.1 glycoside hydrolase family 38 C-terminal domain-containing protein [Clostridium sp.]